MKRYNTACVFTAACAGMGFFGVTMLSLGPILTELSQIVEGANSLPATMSIGIIMGTIIFGPIVDRLGYKWLLIAASLMALAGVQGLAQFDSIDLLHCSIFLLGMGGGILNGETNALVSAIYSDERRGGRLGVLGAFYCIGALLWISLVYLCPDFYLPLNAISVVMAAFIVFFIAIPFPKAEAATDQQRQPLSASLGLLKYPALLAFAFALFFQCGFEGISGNFTVAFLNSTTDLDPGLVTLSLTWFSIGMLCGRLPLGAFMRRFNPMVTLYMYLCVAMAGVALLFTFDSLSIIYLAMALIGFGVGATFPVVINYLAEAFPRQSGTALSIAMFLGLMGQFAFNKVAGLAFDDGEYAWFPIMLAGALVGIMALIPTAVSMVSRRQTSTL
ncbi:MAG: MFS transporter [Bacteroidales bacterium]|nr:MFS transporter [Bacteroidales bacterium]